MARVDPYKNYNFKIDCDGIIRGACKECSGLDSTTESIDYREGGENTTIHKLPGKTTFSEVTLKRGITDSDDLWEWRKMVVDGNEGKGKKTMRRNVSIFLLNDKGEEILRWNLTDAWPSKWEGPSLDATANDVAFETLTLTHEGISRG